MSALVAKELQEQNKILAEILAKSYLEKVYPIGSIYITVSNINPSNTIGGVWERIKDKFLLGAGDNYSAGTSGGSATHSLTVEELASHSHIIKANQRGTAASFKSGDYVDSSSSAEEVALNFSGTYVKPNSDLNWNPESGTASYGQLLAVERNESVRNKPFDIMPPYLAVYMWKRVG